MDLGLTGKVAIVAASSTGIGKSVALGLAAEGAQLALCARRAEPLAETAAEIRELHPSVQLIQVVCDLTHAAAISRLVATTMERFGTVEILFTNAGGPPAGTFEELNDDQWEASFQLTLMSAVRLIREVTPHMKRQHWGRIINLTSISVKQPVAGLILSNSLRSAVVGMAKTLSQELAADNILVNNVCPGYARTDRLAELAEKQAALRDTTPDAIFEEWGREIPLRRVAEPEEIANLVVFLASEKSSYITGATIQVDGGWIKAMI